MASLTAGHKNNYKIKTTASLKIINISVDALRKNVSNIGKFMLFRIDYLFGSKLLANVFGTVTE